MENLNVSIGTRQVTPLVAPPPRQDVSLSDLLASDRPATPAPQVPAPTRPRAAIPLPTPSRTPAPTALPEPPKLQASAEPLPPGPELSQVAGPPPQIQPAEQPKITFETPGAQTAHPGPVSSSQPRVPMPPKTGIEEMARINSRTTSSGGLVVGDLGQGIGGVGAGLSNPGAAPVPTQSALELMSDPMGVDFKPYLIRILSTVRRNWMAVIPESARMGQRRGKVQIQFAISKDGSVPKLVIALPSGAEPLDRAAVAGISASNPFPPLPAEFGGQEVRLQFTFLYNTPR